MFRNDWIVSSSSGAVPADENPHAHPQAVVAAVSCTPQRPRPPPQIRLHSLMT